MDKLIRAPSLKAGGLPLFNAQALLELYEFEGKLEILDFWTYCCINCAHIIPTLKHIEEEFSDSVVVNRGA